MYSKSFYKPYSISSILNMYAIMIHRDLRLVGVFPGGSFGISSLTVTSVLIAVITDYSSGFLRGMFLNSTLQDRMNGQFL